jgi:hypothetical protein
MVETTGNCIENKIQKAASVLTARVWFALVDGRYAVASLSLTLSAYNSKFFGISTNIHIQMHNVLLNRPVIDKYSLLTSVHIGCAFSKEYNFAVGLYTTDQQDSKSATLLSSPRMCSKVNFMSYVAASSQMFHATACKIRSEPLVVLKMATAAELSQCMRMDLLANL